MKAAVSEELKRFVVKDVPKPVCGENDLLLKIHRVSICTSDLMYYEGLFPCPTYPVILRHECSGEVVEVGGNVKNFHLGERGYILGHILSIKGNPVYNVPISHKHTLLFLC